MKSNIGGWWIEEASFFNETMLGIGVSMEAKQKKTYWTLAWNIQPHPSHSSFDSHLFPFLHNFLW